MFLQYVILTLCNPITHCSAILRVITWITRDFARFPTECTVHGFSASPPDPSVRLVLHSSITHIAHTLEPGLGGPLTFSELRSSSSSQPSALCSLALLGHSHTGGPMAPEGPLTSTGLDQLTTDQHSTRPDQGPDRDTMYAR